MSEESTRVSFPQGRENDWRRCAKKKKEILLQRRCIRAKGSGKQCKKNDPESSKLNPKPPDEDIEKRLRTTRSVTAKGKNEERILAPKPEISLNTSTSEVAKEIKTDRMDSCKNLIEETVEKESGVCCIPPTLMVSSLLLRKEGKDMEKVHWKPPCSQKTPQE